MLNIRTLNQGIDRKREELFDEYLEAKHSHFQMRSLADYEVLKKVNLSRSKTQSKFVREMLMDNVREHSNGESAFLYFQEKMQEAGLYLLDEPENSLSPERQQELAQFLENSARFFDCQLIIATHSLHGISWFICPRKSFLSVFTSANSSVKNDMLICLSMSLLYHKSKRLCCLLSGFVRYGLSFGRTG